MTLFEYYCKFCDRKFEVRVPHSERNCWQWCDRCGTPCQRIHSVPAIRGETVSKS